LSQHWELIVAADFFTVEVWTKKGLQRFIILFFIELSARRIEIAGIAAHANGLWMTQIGRNLTDPVDGLLAGKRYLIHDRDPLFTGVFLTMLEGCGIESVKLPPRSPNLNAYAERFVRSIKESCLDRLILFGESSLRTAVGEFIEHYHHERNHQGLENRLVGASRKCWGKLWRDPEETASRRLAQLLLPPSGLRLLLTFAARTPRPPLRVRCSIGV
jgi:hypothetical protein